MSPDLEWMIRTLKDQSVNLKAFVLEWRAKNGETLGGLKSQHHRPYNKLSCMVANYVVILPVEGHALNEESEE
tara:strand:+ start:229 stop:447 length:219 start_codon:yes stop_codon:yes gene_type:complete